MTTTREDLLHNLYGEHFNREIGTPYRQACYHLNVLINKLNTHESRVDPFYISVYDYNHNNQIPFKKPAPGYTYNYSENVILDKIFFDFDKDYNPRAREELKNRVTTSRKREFILELIEAGRLKEPIKQAKATARYILKNYGGEAFLVFSGSKGCHLYIYFEPVLLEHPKECLNYLTRELEKKGLFKINTREEPGLLDKAPVGDVARISKVPGSIHPETGLYCNPFKLDYTYQEIISNSKKEDPPFHDVHPEKMRGSLGEVLLEIDEKIKDKIELQKYQRLFKKLEPKPPARDGIYKKVKIASPGDVLQLNRWPCFKNSPYPQGMRLLLGLICIWAGLSVEDTLEAIKIYGTDKGTYREEDHERGEKYIKSIIAPDGYPKYLFSCRTMKDKGLCLECNEWFYLKLDLPEEFHKRIENYKTTEGVDLMS